MKKINLEVCIDNIESVKVCKEVGIDRFELCSSLALGGISPSPAVVKFAKENTDISLQAMIRPRSGDFCFNDDDIKAMVDEVSFFSDLGVDGVVIGVLDSDFNINLKAIELLVKQAKKNDLCITFHRAIDYVSDINKAMEELINQGVNRILTSGQKNTAFEGIDVIEEMQKKYGDKITIMPGSGVNPANAAEIIHKTGVSDIHCSASKKVNKYLDVKLSLGASSGDLEYQITDIDKLSKIKASLIQG